MTAPFLNPVHYVYAGQATIYIQSLINYQNVKTLDWASPAEIHVKESNLILYLEPFRVAKCL